MTKIISLCEPLIDGFITKDTAIQLIDGFHFHEVKGSYEKAMNLVRKNATIAFANPASFGLRKEVVKDILTDPKNETVCKESDILRWLIEWGRKNKKDANVPLPTFLSDLLPLIRFQLLTSVEIKEFIKSDACSLEKKLEILETVLDHHGAHSDQKIQTYRATPFESSIVSDPTLMKAFATFPHTDKMTKLLYRASRDGWVSKDFHRMCDNKGPTMVIIKSEGGNIFGGYAHSSWDSTGNNKFDIGSYIFSLKNPSSSPPAYWTVNNGTRAICGAAGYGPIFGGNDIGEFSPFSSIFPSHSLF